MGELLAMDWEAIDLGAHTLRVSRAWDGSSKQFLTTKSEAGQDRIVPIVDRLATLLADHAVLHNHRTTGLLFPGAWDPTRPASPNGLRKRARDAWAEAGFTPLGLDGKRWRFAGTQPSVRRFATRRHPTDGS